MDFIRFGELPEDYKSTIFKRNIPQGKEIGVSVYEAHRNSKGSYVPVLPYPLTDSTLDSYTYFLQYFRGHKYLIHGDIIGYGSDNEPLLSNITDMVEIKI